MNMGLHYQDGAIQLHTLASVRGLVVCQWYPPILGRYSNWDQTSTGYQGDSLSFNRDSQIFK